LFGHQRGETNAAACSVRRTMSSTEPIASLRPASRSQNGHR